MWVMGLDYNGSFRLAQEIYLTIRTWQFSTEADKSLPPSSISATIPRYVYGTRKQQRYHCL